MSSVRSLLYLVLIPLVTIQLFILAPSHAEKYDQLLNHDEVAAIEASKQSRRFYIPEVSPKLDTDSAIKLFGQFEQILICHESANSQISDVVKPASKTLIVIGPEGGITEDELKLFEQAGAKIIKLGRPVLRSAHAGIAAVSAVSALMKVW